MICLQIKNEMHTPDCDEPADMDDAAAAAGLDADEDDEEALDMDEFEESGMLDLVDPAVALTTRKTDKTNSNTGTTTGAAAIDNGDSVLHTRTYDLHITYDKYYQTPRLWVVGYDEVN